ncbi:hypothetical protein TWF191_004960 [Orbilia oligospora]|uniref:Uncharacterized protein n=1 Tax=Orbilia oligospora TaxID=2813651 RepID=A0A7C8QVI9_ORBOL|nr:hypothetical protein TWF191_004960 [Orbilia oligospora]
MQQEPVTHVSTRSSTATGTGTSKTQWKKHITTTHREIYLLEPVQKDPKDKKLPIFHHILAPVGTKDDAWYLQIVFDELSSAFDFQPAAPLNIYGNHGSMLVPTQTIYVPLRYIRFAVEYPEKGKLPGNPQLFTGDIKMPLGRRVSKNYGGDNITLENPENEGLISLDDSEVSKDFNRKLIKVPYPNNTSTKISISEILEKLQTKFGHDQFHLIPFRIDDGTLYWGRAKRGLDEEGVPKEHYDMWRSLLNTRTKVSAGGNKKTWRVRYDDRDLKTPLVVRYTDIAENRFRDKGYGEVSVFMEKLVQAINSIYTTPNENRRTNQLTLDVSKQCNLSNYRLLSENPFGLFQTYIHTSEIQSYMEDLALDLQQPKEEDLAKGKALQSTPLRGLPIENDFENRLKDYFSELLGGSSNDEPLDPDSEDEEDAKTGEEGEKMVAQLEQGQQVGGTNQNLGRMEEEPSQASGNNNPVAMPFKGNGSNQKAEGSKLWKHFPNEPHPEGWRHSSSKHDNIALSSRKITEAKGTRKTQKSQRDVMGLSASGLAENVFKWTPPDPNKTGCKKRQLRNGLYMAEWLHLCAYSWGGLNGDDDKGNLKSSQTVENLVFGSSEANSCMTRYESAWQSLFTDEADLIGKIKGSSNGGEVNITGELQVQRNPSGKKRNHDNISGNFQYIWEEVDLPGDDSHLAKLAARAKLLAYTISYRPRMYAYKKKRLLILDRQQPSVSVSTVFHPFSRRFFHRAEYLLDAALYEAMYRITIYDKLKKYDRNRIAELVSERFLYTNKFIRAVLNDRNHDPEAKQKVQEGKSQILIQEAMKQLTPSNYDPLFGQSGTSPSPPQSHSGQTEDPGSQSPKEKKKKKKEKVNAAKEPDPEPRKKPQHQQIGQGDQGGQSGAQYGNQYGGQGGQPVSQYGSQYGNQYGGQGGNQYGNQYSSQYGNQYGNQGGQSGSQYGNQYGNQYGGQGGNQYGGQGGSQYGNQYGNQYGGQGGQGSYYGGSQS